MVDGVRRDAGDPGSSTATFFWLATSASGCVTWSSRIRGSRSGHLCSSRFRTLALRGTGVGEAVTDAWDRQDVIRTRGLSFDLPAQVPDVDVDHAGFDRILVTPDRVEDFLSAQHLARVG